MLSPNAYMTSGICYKNWKLKAEQNLEKKTDSLSGEILGLHWNCLAGS